MWSASFASGALVGLLGSWLILDIMAGFPNRKSGGSWDIGPIAFPVMGFIAYLLAHSLCYVTIDEEKKLEGQSWQLVWEPFVTASPCSRLRRPMAIKADYATNRT